MFPYGLDSFVKTSVEMKTPYGLSVHRMAAVSATFCFKESKDLHKKN